MIFVIRHRVKAGATEQYETWLKRIMPLAATYPGHQGVHVIRPAGNHDEYVIVVRFASEAEAKVWTDSDARKEMLKEVDGVIARDNTELKSGIEYWFTPPGEKRAPGWKQWLVTTSVIAPLTMIVPPLFRPVFGALPWLGVFGVSHVLVAATIVALTTFIVMPRYVKLVRPWLYRGDAEG